VTATSGAPRGRSLRPAAWRRVARASSLGVAAALLTIVPGDPGSAQSTVFYRTSAQANSEFVEIFRPGYILEPIVQINALDTQTTLSSTGIRDALASLLNPGPLGDFPGLLGLAVAGLPPIPYPGYPLTVTATHPLTPEAVIGLGDVPGGGASDAASVRPFTATARAGEDFAEATGTGSGASFAAGLVRVGAVESRTYAEDNGGSVTVTAETRLGAIEIAGIIAIEGLETTTVATIDSDNVRIETTSALGAVRALGAELAIDESGVRVVTVLGVPAPPDIAIDRITGLLEGALSDLGIEVRFLDGGVVEGPADGVTTYQAVGSGLQIQVPVTIPESVPIPSLPIPLGIPVGGGIPTVMTVSLGRASVEAIAGSGSGFGAPVPGGAGSAAPGGTGSSFVPPASATGTRGTPLPLGGAVSATGSVPPGAEAAAGALPAGQAARPVSAARPDLTPAFRWTLLTAIAAIAMGWPLARRRLTGVPGLSVSAVLRSVQR